MNDLIFLQRCEALAALATQRQEPPVGSVVVLEDQIIGEGIEAGKAKQDISCHAEVEAIREVEKNTAKTCPPPRFTPRITPCTL